MKKGAKTPVTPAVRALRESGVEVSHHLYKYIEHGGTRVAAEALNVDEPAVVKTIVMEDEAKKADTTLADTVTKLAMESKNADGILKKVKYFETKTMRNEVEIGELDKTLRETNKMGSDNEQKLDELTRKLGVQEDELKRALERAEMAEGKLKTREDVYEGIENFPETYSRLFSGEKLGKLVLKVLED